MKHALQSLFGGVLVMAVSFMGMVLGGGRFFLWVMAWPALLLKFVFSPPAPDQIFPALGSLAGIISSLLLATLTYSLLIFLLVRCCSGLKKFR